MRVDIHIDRQTKRQTDRHADHNTSPLVGRSNNVERDELIISQPYDKKD